MWPTEQTPWGDLGDFSFSDIASLFGMNGSGLDFLGNGTGLLNGSGGLLDLMAGAQKRRGLTEQPYKLLAVVLCAVSLAVNVSSLLAIARVRGRLSTNLRLLTSLSVSNILICACMLLANLDLSALAGNAEQTCLFVGRRSLKMTSHLIYLLNLFGLAVDHYYAICRPLSHVTVTRRHRCDVIIGLMWVGSGVVGFSDFYVPFFPYGHCAAAPNVTVPYCQRVWCSAYNSEYPVIAVAFLLIVAMSCIYFRIYRAVRAAAHFRGRRQGLAQRSRRGLYTTLLVVGSFVVCWLPYCIFQVVITVQTLLNTPKSVAYFTLVYRLDFYLYDLLLVNCLLDPLIYALRMGDVRRGYRRWVECVRQGAQPEVSVRFTRAIRSDTDSTCAANIRYRGNRRGQPLQQWGNEVPADVRVLAWKEATIIRSNVHHPEC